MDIVTMNAAANLAIKKLFANGVIGGEVNATLTYDGTGEKIDMLGNGETLAKASTEYINGNNISKITVRVTDNDGEIAGETVLTKDDLSMEADDTFTIVALKGVATEVPILVSVAADVEGEIEKGTYVRDVLWDIEGDKAHQWVCSVEYTKAVSTIDPKYLPGLTLPVVELSEETATALMGTGSATLTAEEAAAFDEMAANCAPFVIIVRLQGAIAVACICQYGTDTTGAFYSGAIDGVVRDTENNVTGISMSMVYFGKTSSGWNANFIAKGL